MRFPTADKGNSLSSRLIQSPQNAKFATSSNSTPPRRYRKCDIKFSGAPKQPRWITVFLRPGRQGMFSVADCPERLSLPVGPSDPAAPYPWEASRGATAARAAPQTRQVEGDEVLAIPLRPSSVVPSTPSSRPQGSGLAPVLE